MIAANFSTVRNRFEDYCDKVTNGDETVIVTRNEGKNVVIISAERYQQLKTIARNAEYFRKLDRGLAQVHAGQGIMKSLEELEAMASDEQ